MMVPGKVSESHTGGEDGGSGISFVRVGQGRPKSPLSLLHKIKDPRFPFTNSFIDLDTLSVPAVSHMVGWWSFSRSQFDHCQLQLIYPTVGHRPEGSLQHKMVQIVFDMPVSHSTFSTCCTNLFAFRFRFYLS